MVEQQSPETRAEHDGEFNRPHYDSAANLVISGRVITFPARSGKRETRLFNRRQDAWNDHFDFDAGRFQLLGYDADRPCYD